MRLSNKIVLVLFALLFNACSHRDKLTSQLQAASSAKEEGIISKKINENCQPETFFFRDAKGKKLNLKGFSDQELKSVEEIELIWSDNFSIKHKIIDRSNIKILIGE